VSTITNNPQPPYPEELEELRAIADIQFYGAGDVFLPSNIQVIRSKTTQRIRAVLLDGKILATLRASDYRFILRIWGGIRLNNIIDYPFLRVIVSNKYSGYIIEGGNVFTKHIVFMDPHIRPGDEVLVLNEDLEVIAVGRAILPGWISTLFSRGEAVRVRESIKVVRNEGYKPSIYRGF